MRRMLVMTCRQPSHMRQAVIARVLKLWISALLMCSVSVLLLSLEGGAKLFQSIGVAHFTCRRHSNSPTSR